MDVIAYRFDGVDDRVEFAIGSFASYTFSAFTYATFLKRGSNSGTDGLLMFVNNALGASKMYQDFSGALPRIRSPAASSANYSSLSLNTTDWYLLVVTWSGSGAARFHWHNGTSWSHQNANSGSTANSTLASNDRLFVSCPAGFGIFLDADVVCAGIKKTDSSDATVETLSRTAFSAWAGYGFDWLIGFDTSMEAAGILQDQGTAGTGDEVAINGTSLVSDPAGWSWALAVAPVANFTGTPLSGAAPLNVAFTDTSTNVPTSWAWTFGDGGTSTSQNPSHNYTSAGTYNVQLTATNAAGSDVELKSSYVVVSVAPPVANFTATPLSGDVPLEVDFTDTSTGSPTSWLWDFGDGATSTSQNPTHTYTTPGVYTVELDATNAGGTDNEAKVGYITVTSAIVGFSIAFDDAPMTAEPTWTRIDTLAGCRVQEYSIDRGRPTEFDKTDTGTATVRIIDREGLFDPSNGTSPYNGLILPGKQAGIALQNPVSDEWFVLFRGFIESWHYRLDLTRQYMELELQLVDGFAILARAILEVGVDGALPGPPPYTSPPYATPEAAAAEEALAGLAAGNVLYGETLGSAGDDRIVQILEDMNPPWPDDLREVFSLNVRLGPKAYGPGTSVLDAIWDAVDADWPGGANAFMTKTGILRVTGRQARLRPLVAEYNINKRTVGDPSGWELDEDVVPISELEWTNGVDTIVNACSATPQWVGTGATIRQLNPDPPHNDDVAGQYVKNQDSIDQYGLRELTFDQLQMVEGIESGSNSMVEAKKIATYYVENYASEGGPNLRISRMVFKTRRPGNLNGSILWEHLCKAEISDLLTVITAHPGGGGFLEQEFYVEGLHYTVRPGTPTYPIVELSLDVSPRVLFNPWEEDEDPA